jgi:hypothetical protein
MALGIQVCERTVSVLMTRAGIYGAGQDGDLDLFVSGAACRDGVVSDQQQTKSAVKAMLNTRLTNRPLHIEAVRAGWWCLPRSVF